MIRAPNQTLYAEGPFIAWAGPVGNGSAPVHRCITKDGAMSRHFVSAAEDCLGLGVADVVLGHSSVRRNSNTPRSLRLCSEPGGVLRHSIDAACEATGAHTLEHLGFVH